MLRALQPLVVCPACFFPCVQGPHFTADGRVLYAASRSQPFYVASADGQVTPLPVYSGYLAYGPRRVVSDNGLLCAPRYNRRSMKKTRPEFFARGESIVTMIQVKRK